MTPACPRPPRALSCAHPKWEQAVRRVLRKDEHVVFAVIGGWVRAACCKRSWVAERLAPGLRMGVRVWARHILVDMVVFVSDKDGNTNHGV